MNGAFVETAIDRNHALFIEAIHGKLSAALPHAPAQASRIQHPENHHQPSL